MKMNCCTFSMKSLEGGRIRTFPPSPTSNLSTLSSSTVTNSDNTHLSQGDILEESEDGEDHRDDGCIGDDHDARGGE